MANHDWEDYADTLQRVKVEGGYVFRCLYREHISLCFVPDIDLQRYQAHLRDAYNKGYEQGVQDTKDGVEVK